MTATELQNELTDLLFESPATVNPYDALVSMFEDFTPNPAHTSHYKRQIVGISVALGVILVGVVTSLIVRAKRDKKKFWIFRTITMNGRYLLPHGVIAWSSALAIECIVVECCIALFMSGAETVSHGALVWWNTAAWSGAWITIYLAVWSLGVSHYLQARTFPRRARFGSDFGTSTTAIFLVKAIAPCALVSFFASMIPFTAICYSGTRRRMFGLDELHAGVVRLKDSWSSEDELAGNVLQPLVPAMELGFTVATLYQYHQGAGIEVSYLIALILFYVLVGLGAPITAALLWIALHIKKPSPNPDATSTRPSTSVSQTRPPLSSGIHVVRLEQIEVELCTEEGSELERESSEDTKQSKVVRLGMSAAQQPIELSPVSRQTSVTDTGASTPATLGDNFTSAAASEEPLSGVGRTPVEALNTYPDGGIQAWLQVVFGFFMFFTTIGSVYSWGVVQDALVEEGLSSSSTLAFVGSTQAVMQALLAIPFTGFVRRYGPRPACLVAATCTVVGPVIAGSSTHSVIGLVFGQGVIFGIGQGLVLFAVATLPSSYFLKKRNLATGIVYAGGGIGGAVFALTTSAMISKVGVAWSFRINGFICGALNFPCAWFVKSRLPLQTGRSTQPIVDWSMFKDARFPLLLAGSCLAVFPLFIPPFFLPLYAGAIGLSTSTSSLLLAGFNLASAGGRILFGLGADRILGSVNSLLACLAFVGISTLAVWPVAETLPPLVIFAAVNGFCSGGFFSLMPGVISTLFMGAPIGGYILDAFGGAEGGFVAFRPAIFYSGCLSLAAAGLVLAIRIIQSRQIWKRV
ncbi:hypothetical protein MNV49_002624 [Pseudohyphozyma bogoriensis]|nr:hypothetical protein MNV49_002624 [Pseudohyphozyma bogoriensis]